MKKIFLFSIFAASLFVASCESEFEPTVLGGGNIEGDIDVQEPSEGFITLSLNASSSEQIPEVKSLFASEGTTVKWGTGDIISLIDDQGEVHVSEPSATSAEEITFTFKNWPASRKPLYAIHSGAYDEYLPDDTFSDGTINTLVEINQVPSKQNNFPRAALLTVGNVVENNGNYSVQLRNICGLVKVTVTNDKKYSAIKIQGSDADVLSGKIAVTPAQTAEEAPTFTVTEGSSSVVLDYSKGLPAANYYLCVLPGTIHAPIVTLVEKETGKETKLGRSDVLIQSGVVVNFGALDTVTQTSAVDLSAEESANCYMINQAGEYRFKAVKGNSATALEGVESVEVLWSESSNINDVVASVQYNNGYIHFSTPESYNYGNALIAAKDNQGTILWSWHIWATNSSSYPSDVTYPNGLVMMDRNLGSRGAGKYLSLLYQWGRKDPIPGSAGSGSCVSLVYSSNDLWKTYGSDDTDVAVMGGFTFLFAKTRCNIDVAVKNPTTIYGVAGDGDAAIWANGQTNADLWGGSKTVNDPCPPGYKVPSAFEAGAVAADDVKLSTSRFVDLSSATWSYGNTRTAVAEWEDANTTTSFVSSAVVDLYGSTGGAANTYSVRNPKCSDTEGRSYIWTASRTTDNSRRASVLYIRNKITDGKNATSIEMEASPKNNAYAVRCEKIQNK